MRMYHAFLALLVVVIWGLNFLFVKLSLEEFSPLFLCALRFMLASIPAVFFIKRPNIPFRIVALYGLVMFALQFGFLFIGMNAGMTPGMASLIMQIQIFFSLFFAVVFLGEQPNRWQIFGALVSFSGIILVSLHFDHDTSFLGFILILASAATWGVGNLITKKAKQVNMLSLVVWGCLVASVPMLVLSLLVEGSSVIKDSYQHVTILGAFALLYIVCMSTWVGYGLWNWLLSLYPVSVVIPFTLLIPIVGLASSILIFKEPLHLWKLEAAVLVIGGLGINLLSARLMTLRAKRKMINC